MAGPVAEATAAATQEVPGRPALPVRRRFAAAVVLVIGLPTLISAMLDAGWRAPPIGPAGPVLLVLMLVVVVAVLGGVWVGLPSALIGALALNWYFTPPFGSVTVGAPAGLLVLGAYLVVALVVSGVVAFAARSAAQAQQAGAQARALSALAGASLAADQTLPDLLERVRTTFALREVSLLETGGEQEVLVERVGAAPDSNAEAETERRLRVPAGRDAVLSASGPELLAEDRRVLTAFAEAAGTALQGRRLAEQARTAARLAAAEEMRSALLAAVGHDLRTPLAGIKAASWSLRQADLDLTDPERAELLEGIEASADRLHALVTNLLDASRIRVDAVVARCEPTGIGDVLGPVLAALPPDQRARVRVDLPVDLPDVLADAVLLERVLANLVDNALRYSPPGTPVTVSGRLDGSGDVPAEGAMVLCEVVDAGPGVPPGAGDALFAPFQRLGDQSPGGVGLGLAVARGFTEAMGGTVTPAAAAGADGAADGGTGLRMQVRLPVAVGPVAPPGGSGEVGERAG